MRKLSRKIICLICCLFIITNTMYAEGSGEVYLEETEFCSINDFSSLQISVSEPSLKSKFPRLYHLHYPEWQVHPPSERASVLHSRIL